MLEDKPVTVYINEQVLIPKKKRKVLKMGPKLRFHFTNKLYQKEELIQITITKLNKQYLFLTRFNRIISIRK